MTVQHLGDGRALLQYDATRDLEELVAELEDELATAFGDGGVEMLVWQAPKGDWVSRRVAWRLGFAVDGTVRSWLPSGDGLVDAWVGTLLPGDTREPRAPWLEATVLDGHGVRLRAFGPQDVPRIVQASADPLTQRWLGQLPAPYTEADAHAYLHAIEERHATNAGITWAVVDPAEDQVLGSVGFFDYTPRVECEIGYWTHPEARGRGVATGALAVATSYVFGELGVNRVKAYAALDNTASRRVIERNGYRQTGIERLGAVVRDGREDMALYDLLVSELTGRGEPASGSTSAANASTANPASERAAPTSSGDRKP
jgi:RimJ/RimL family protein N-acetyltransferase